MMSLEDFFCEPIWNITEERKAQERAKEKGFYLAATFQFISGKGPKDLMFFRTQK